MLGPKYSITILDIQDNTECWNYSRGPTGGQDSKKISRNTCKNTLNINKIKFNTNEEKANYIHWRFRRDHGKKLVST